MSSRKRTRSRRRELLDRLDAAGRELSDAVVLFHGALADTLGLGTTDWKMLGLLEQHGPLTAGELAARSRLAPASVTAVLDRLEERGWLTRARDPQDARRVVVSLDWGAAAEKRGAAFEGLTRRLVALYARYTDDELELLVELMTAIASCQRDATAEITTGDAGDGPRLRRRRRG